MVVTAQLFNHGSCGKKRAELIEITEKVSIVCVTALRIAFGYTGGRASTALAPPNIARLYKLGGLRLSNTLSCTADGP